jgi:YVTN family beta-propeller protein
VLLSNATRELVEDELPDGMELRDLGTYRLKDIDRPEHLYQLVVADLPSRFPPLRAEKVAAPHPLRRRSILAGAIAGVIAAAIAIPIFALGRGGPDGASIDAAAGNSLAIFDPASNRLVADIGSGTTPTDVALGAGAAWITNTADGTVDRIDLATRTVRQTIRVGNGPEGIAFDAGSVWVANGLDRTVVRIDPRSNVVTQTIGVGNGPGGIAVGGGFVWVVNRDDRTLTKIDAKSGDVVKAYPAGAGPVDVAVGAGSVWVTSEADGKVLRIDPRTGSVTETIGVGRSPGAIAATARAVWVVNSVDATVSRIDPRSSGVSATISVGGQPTGIAAAGGGAWVADAGGSLIRIDPKTSQPSKPLAIGGTPAGVAAGPQGVFVAVRPAAGAHRGGTLAMVNSGWFDYDPGTIDPGAGSIGLPLALTNDGLTDFKRTGGREGYQVVPDLATSLPQPTDDGKSYTFTLRAGIRYSTGRPVRAGDFRRALERVFDVSEFFPEAFFEPIVGAKGCLAHPKSPCDLSRGIVADDAARTVTFHLTQPDADLLTKLATIWASPVPPGTPSRDAGNDPLPTTGPYRIATYVPGKQMRLVRNPYFREWSRAATPAGYSDEIVIRLGIPAREQVAAVEHGDADVADLTTEDVLADAGALRARYGGRLHSVPSSLGNYLALNTRVPPFSYARARRAVNLAIDRSAVARAAGGPEVASTSCQILPANFPAYGPVRRPRPHVHLHAARARRRDHAPGGERRLGPRAPQRRQLPHRPARRAELDHRLLRSDRDPGDRGCPDGAARRPQRRGRELGGGRPARHRPWPLRAALQLAGSRARLGARRQLPARRQPVAARPALGAVEGVGSGQAREEEPCTHASPVSAARRKTSTPGSTISATTRFPASAPSPATAAASCSSTAPPARA